MNATEHLRNDPMRNELVRRRDLDVVEHTVRGESRWTVREPWASATFQLTEHEFFILNQLEGEWTTRSVCLAFEERFAPLRLPPQKLFRFLHVLHREGLLVSRHEGQSDVLNQRDARKQSRERWAGLANPFAVRFQGIDLSRYFDRLAAALRPVFRPVFFSAAGLSSIGLSAICLIAITALMALIFRDDWVREIALLADGELLTNGLLLLVAISATKVLHELGHALTLHVYGGRCRDIGVMFLVFAPCLYCDVSDAWMFPSKWKRIAVGVAGIAVELLLATFAFWVWWFTPIGPIHNVSLMIMLVCTANTLLLNGNPLMRYDGYYVLSDLSERPNLAAHSREQLRQFLSGSGAKNGKRLDVFAVVYAILSFFYRISIFAVIFVGLYGVLEPYRLELLVVLLGVWTLTGSLAMSIGRRPRRMAMSGLALGALGIVILFAPLPTSVESTGVVRPVRMETLTATESGWMNDSKRYGDTVAKDDIVLRIESVALEKEIEALDADRQRQAVIIDTLSAQSVTRADVAAALIAAQTRATELERQWEFKQDEREELTMKAPFTGILLPPDGRSTSTSKSPELNVVSNAANSLPLDRMRHQGHVDRGEVIARVAALGKSEALLLVPENERPRIFNGMAVVVRVRSAPDRPIRGMVREISELSEDLDSRYTLALPNKGTGGDSPQRFYVARVSLTDDVPDTLLYGSAKARFKLPRRSMAQRLSRWWSNTFYFGT